MTLLRVLGLAVVCALLCLATSVRAADSESGDAVALTAAAPRLGQELMVAHTGATAAR